MKISPEETKDPGFFGESVLSPPLSELLGPGEPLWAALGRLEEYLKDTVRPNVEGAVEPGRPLGKTVLVLPDGLLDEGFEIVEGRVLIAGEEVPEAAVLYEGAVFMDTRVEIGRGAVVEPFALVKGPAWIGGRAQVRHGAYIRGSVWVGEGAVVGHTTEVKNSIFLDGAKAGHFAYVGDSILGAGSNLGAGTKLANLRLDGRNVRIGPGPLAPDSGRRKLGALLGDGCQTGCNSVLNPGSVLGKGSLVAPNATVRPGIHPPGSVLT